MFLDGYQGDKDGPSKVTAVGSSSLTSLLVGELLWTTFFEDHRELFNVHLNITAPLGFSHRADTSVIATSQLFCTI